MDANAFLNALAEKQEAGEPVGEAAVHALLEESVIFSNQTPSGVLVEYSPAPRRFYRVNGVEVVSVTTALKVLAKDLSWWGMTVGIEGVVKLFEKGRLGTFVDWKDGDKEKVQVVDDNGWSDDPLPTQIAKLMTQEKITVNHSLTSASDRGTAAHKSLETWADSGGNYFPTPQEFPEEYRNWVNGVLTWIDAMDGAGKPVMSETMIGSDIHGFAGRQDLVLELTEPREFIYRALKTPKTVVVQPGRYGVDMKTKNKRPKDPYTTDMKQLAGYEIAAVECGYPPTDGQFVLYVMADGTYEFVPSHAKAEDFLSALQVYKTDVAMKERK